MSTYLSAGRRASNAQYRSSRVRPSTATSTGNRDDPDEPAFGVAPLEPGFAVDEAVSGPVASALAER